MQSCDVQEAVRDIGRSVGRIDKEGASLITKRGREGIAILEKLMKRGAELMSSGNRFGAV